ncbi:MAG: hypothetical protein AAFQ82_06315 [Myxococcota bacterium]
MTQDRVIEPKTPRASSLVLGIWASVAAAAALVYVVLHSYPLQSGAPDPSLVELHGSAALPGQLMFLLAVTSPLALMIVAFSGLRADAGRNFWIRVGLLFLIPWLSFVVARQSAWPTTRSALERAALRAKPLILAIEKHRVARGAPPTSLRELNIDPPNTGMRGYPAFQYRARSTPDARTELWWYDLGPRAGRSLTHSWRSADGEISHAVLVARVDAIGSVRELFADRMPVEPQRDGFDRATWNSSPQRRVSQVTSLLENHREKLTTGAQLIAMIGEPTGKRVEVDAPWELRVPSSPSDLDEPSFFYWPTRAYPEHIDGAPIERIGDWAYLVR